LIIFDSDCHIASLGIFRFTNTMHQIIHETITVAGIFQQASFKPVWFIWKQRRLKINDITLISDIKEGSVKKTVYSVQAQDNIYRLDYYFLTQDWFLESIWIDD